MSLNSSSVGHRVLFAGVFRLLSDRHRLSFRAAARGILIGVLIASNPANSGEQPSQEPNSNATQYQGTTSIAPLLSIPPSGERPAFQQPQFQTYYFENYGNQQPTEVRDSFLGMTSGLWVAIFTFALVLTTIGQAVLILRAEQLTRKALRVSQRQSVRTKVDSARHARETAEALRIAGNQATAAQKSADTAEKSLIAAHRPWLKIERVEIVADITHEPNGDLRIVLRFHVKNVGSAPALGVRITGVAVVSFLDTTLINDPRTMDICKALRTAETEVGVAIFPGDIALFDNYIFHVAQTDMDRWVATVRDGIEKNPDIPASAKQAFLAAASTFVPAIRGCVDYLIPADRSHHQTGFGFNVLWMAKGGSTSRIDANRSVMPLAELAVREEFFGSSYAD